MTWNVTLGGVDTQQTFTQDSLDELRYVDEAIGLPAILERIVEHVRDGWSAKSSDALTIASTGSLALTCTINRPWTLGLPLRVSKIGATSNKMDGTVTSYDQTSGALVMALTSGATVGVTGGSWLVTLSGTGAAGAAGPAFSTAATETVSGIAELATQAETNAGTDDARIVTPLKFLTTMAAYVAAALAAMLAATINMADNILQRPVLKDYGETLQAIGNTGTTCTLDLTNGNAFSATLNGNCTFTFSNPPATGTHGSFILYLLNDGTPGRSVTFPASVKWSGGTPPSRDTTASVLNNYAFITKDAGANWFGNLVHRSPS